MHHSFPNMNNSMDKILTKMETAPFPGLYLYGCISLKLQSTAYPTCTSEEGCILDCVNAISWFLYNKAEVSICWTWPKIFKIVHNCSYCCTHWLTCTLESHSQEMRISYPDTCEKNTCLFELWYASKPSSWGTKVSHQ